MNGAARRVGSRGVTQPARPDSLSRMSWFSLEAAGALVALCLATAPSACAQGPGYRERWGYLHLERRRAEVLEELRGRSEQDVREVARLLARPEEGVPFTPVADALALLRGVESDAAFRLRCTLGLFVLPEVVDPDGRQAACKEANFSVSLPFSLPSAGEMVFEFVVRDAAGAEVSRQRHAHKTGIEDVRLAQAGVSLACGELADGAYEVELVTLLDGAAPREHDPTLRWRFHVLRGYQQRSELALGAAIVLRKELEPLRRAQLDGVALRVSRAYAGEAFAVRSDAVVDLERLERCVANLQSERPPLQGLLGMIPVGLPDGERTQLGVARMPEGDGPHPMVVFASGAPVYGVSARRPVAPQVREAEWLLRELGDFGAADGVGVLVLDSPGAGVRYADALVAALDALPKVLPRAGARPVLVCDREAAGVVALQLRRLAPLVSGIVLIGTGAVPAAALGSMQGRPLRLVPLSGYPASKTVERLRANGEAAPGDDKEALDVQLLHARPTPWLFGVAWSRPELGAFVREALDLR